MKLDKKVYDVMKWIAQYLLPALGTLYFSIGKIWGLPYSEEVIGTIAAIDTFLGVLLGISTSSYEGDGILHVTRSNDKNSYFIEVDCPLETLKNNQTFLLKIREDPPQFIDRSNTLTES